MTARAEQRNGHLRRLTLGVLVVTVMSVALALTVPSPDPSESDHATSAPRTSPIPPAAADPARPVDPPAPPNLADPATPLPTGLPAGEPVRLVVDGTGMPPLGDLDPTIDLALQRDGVAVVATTPESLPGAVDRLRDAGATRIEVDATVAQHATVTPTDPLWSQWWGARQFGLPTAWGSTLGTAATVIAVIDSGVSELPELAGRVLPGTTYLGAGANPLVDLDGHGTSSAIVAAGAINNGVAAGGSCPQCLVLPVQVVDPATGLAYLSDVAAGNRWATDNGADVISISLGGPSTISALSSAVTYANSRGVIVLASAGNEGNEVVNYPAGLTNVIGVAALDSLGALASWSTRGSWVTTAVAGCNITQRIDDGAGIGFCGTSSAAPLLAGAVALLHSRFPTSTVAALTARVVESSTAGVLTAHGSASAATLVTSPVPPGVVTPGAPSITAIEPGAGQLVVSYAAPTSNGGSPITGFEVSLDGGPFATATVSDPSAPAGSITLGGLANGTTYRIAVRAKNIAGSGSASADAVGTPRTIPDAVGRPEAEAAGASAVRFGWTLPATGGSPITRMELQWREGTTVDDGDAIEELGPATTSFIIEDLSAASTVSARVRAVNAAGSGPWSAVATATSDADSSSNVVNPPTPNPEPEPEPEPVPLGPVPFTDVPTGGWFDLPTRWAFATGVTTGIDSTTFSPTGVLDRAQWLTMLWRLAGSPPPQGTNPFIDVSPTSYYADATAWASENGVTTGVGGGTTFEPRRSISRAEAVTMLWRLAGNPQPASPVAFPDVPDGRYFSPAVAWAKEVGVTTGVGTTGLFAPDGRSTRAEAVTLLWRWVGAPSSLPAT